MSDETTCHDPAPLGDDGAATKDHGLPVEGFRAHRNRQPWYILVHRAVMEFPDTTTDRMVRVPSDPVSLEGPYRDRRLAERDLRRVLERITAASHASLIQVIGPYKLVSRAETSVKIV